MTLPSGAQWLGMWWTRGRILTDGPILAAIERTHQAVRFLDARMESLMSTVADLKAAIAKLSADVTADIGIAQDAASALKAQIADLQAKLASSVPVTDADLQALIDQVNAADAALNSAVANAVPPSV